MMVCINNVLASVAYFLTMLLEVDASKTHNHAVYHKHLAARNSTGLSTGGKITHDYVFTQSNVVTEIPEPISSTDISSLIDNIVSTWVQTDPKYNASQAEHAKLMSLASTLKEGMLQSDNARRSLVEDAPASPHDSLQESFLPPYPIMARTTLHARNITNSTLTKAREIVRLAQAEADAKNVERLNNPRLNSYFAKETVPHPQMKRALEANLFQVNDTVAAAAALVAEADAALDDTPSEGELFLAKQNSKRSLSKRAGPFWMEGVEKTGQWPYAGSANDGYRVFRNVKDYGAKGDGRTDDTAAINKAMQEGNRCGPDCGSSTIKGAIVYFPAGTYLISSSIEAYYNTQMIGDATNLPILLAAPSFTGLGVVSSDKYIEDAKGGQWFINQSNFLRQMRNFIIDITKANMNNIAGMHWQVAQATSIQNVYFLSSSAAGKAHQGIFAENGSGGFMSDLYFAGGAIGIRCGNQQFTTRNFQFEGVQTAIEMLWDWGWTWKSLRINNANYGIRVNGSFVGGSIVVLDSKFSNTVVGIEVSTPKGSDEQQHFSINLDNVVMESVGGMVIDTVAGVIENGGSSTIQSWVLGKVYDEANPDGKYQKGGALSAIHPKTASLMGGPQGGYFERSKPQYEDLTPNDFISARLIAKGDGKTDDAMALNMIAALGAQTGRPVFLAAGSYIVRDTVKFPPGLKMIGECWSQIVAQGVRFMDPNNPIPMINVGDKGEVGTMELQDIMFTNEGATSGLNLMDWNIAATSPGAAAMWDCHFRIGGAAGSRLQVANCPKQTGTVNPNCIAGTMLLHMTSEASGYIENMWAWVADHDLDSGPAQTQIDIYVARGVLIETTTATWLYGTASEHSVFYQYTLANAANLFMGMIQTESPYFLPKPQAPAPFTKQVGKVLMDPKFDDCPSDDPFCKAAWGLRIIGSKNIHIHGAGLYNWFQDYTQTCVPLQSCQRRVVEIKNSGGIFFHNLYTIGTVEMINARGRQPITAKANTNQDIHPKASIINAWLLSAAGGNDDDSDDEDWGTLEECTAAYETVEDVANAANQGKVQDHCVEKYFGDALSRTLDKAVNDYGTLISSGYDGKFAIFEKQMKALVPQQLKEVMEKAQSSGFWTCKETYTATCCGDCGWMGCTGGCDGSANCVSGQRTKDVDCPTFVPILGTTVQPKISYTLKDSDGFYNMLSKDYGIDKSWITFEDITVYIHPGCNQNINNAEQLKKCQKERNIFWTGYPSATKISIPNPKTVLGTNVDAMRALAEDISLGTELAHYGFSFNEVSEVVDGSSVIVLLFAAGIDAMNKVVDLANEATAQERKESLFNFISAILMIAPGVIPAGIAIDQFGLRGLMAVLGAIGNPATLLYEATQSPEALISLIAELLMAGKGGRTGKQDFKGAAAKRRTFAEKEYTAVGPSARRHLDMMYFTRCNRRGD